MPFSRRRNFKFYDRSSGAVKQVVPRPRVGKYRGNMTNAHGKGRVMDIAVMNRGPVPNRKSLTFHWCSYIKIDCAGGGYSSNSTFLSLRSIYDPNYQITGAFLTNTSCPWYAELMGSSPGQYQNVLVKYVDVKIRICATTEDSTAMFCAGVTNVGSSDYPTNTFIQQIASRASTMSKSLEYFGDTSYQTFKFRVYPYKYLNCSKKAYYTDSDFVTAYNTNSGTAPWLALSVGDGCAADGSGVAVEARGQIWMDYHCVVSNPVLNASDS